MNEDDDNEPITVDPAIMKQIKEAMKKLETVAGQINARRAAEPVFDAVWRFETTPDEPVD